MVRRWLYKMKLFLKGVVLEELRGIELVLKGEAQLVAHLLGLDVEREANEQMGNWCLSDLKGEIDVNRGSVGTVNSLMPLNLGCSVSYKARNKAYGGGGKALACHLLERKGYIPHLNIEKNISI